MPSNSSIGNLGSALAVQANQIENLQALLRLAARGHDVSPAAEQIVRYCVESSTRKDPTVLSLALDLLLTCPRHRVWERVYNVLVQEVLEAGNGALITLQCLEGLPRTVAARMIENDELIEAIRGFIAQGGERGKVAVRGLVHLVLQEKIQVDRRKIESLWGLLFGIIDQKDPAVFVEGFRLLTEFALIEDVRGDRVTIATARRLAMASSIWSLLTARAKQISSRLQTVIDGKSGQMSLRLDAIKVLSRIAAVILNLKAVGLESRKAKSLTPATVSPTSVETDENVRWALMWVGKHLVRCCDDADRAVVYTACLAILHVCSQAHSIFYDEYTMRWGEKAVTKLSRWIFDFQDKVGLIQTSAATISAIRGLAALGKGSSSGKFMVTTSIQLLASAVKIPGRADRLEVLSILATCVIEFDLSGKDGGLGNTLASLINSSPWKEIIGSGQEDPEVPGEVVSCFAQSLLDASRKIVSVNDAVVKASLTDAWALMVAKLLLRSIACLSWSHSPSASFAREMFLKLFEALGQYTKILLVTRGTSLTEYEHIQELVVKAILKQEESKTRASLLACITNYWLASGLKAEGNAGVVLKGIWIHAQQHFNDTGLMLSEMRRGALWSAAKKGLLTPRQRAITGGYVSIVTAFLKSANAIVEAVGSAANEAFEKRIFGTLALETAADEGSTLVTDYAYTSFSSALSLVQHVPRAAEKILKMLKRYRGVLIYAESADFIVQEYIDNIISALEMYKDDFYPKLVASKNVSSMNLANTDGMYSWLGQITQSCAQTTSRLSENVKERETVEAEDRILHGSYGGKQRSRPFHKRSFESRDDLNAAESRRVTLSGTSDSFRVVASHEIDNVKGLVHISIVVCKKSKLSIPVGAILFSVGGALTPLPETAVSYSLGEMGSGEEQLFRTFFAVRRKHGSRGIVLVKISVADEASGGRTLQSCEPYYIPSSDVLLLRLPSRSAGVDVFRRRWDLMREATTFQIYLRESQTVDDLIDILQRKSGCLKFVGRMRSSSHVGFSIADSSRGDYVALAAVAPEAHGHSGQGPCFVHVTIRSQSKPYCKAFQREVRDWISPLFRIVSRDQNLPSSEEGIIKPQDAYFITTGDRRTPYQRWRDAHRHRITA